MPEFFSTICREDHQVNLCSTFNLHVSDLESTSHEFPHYPKASWHPICALPGPTHVPDEVMHAMQRPMTDLADPRVAALIAACETGMKSLLNSPKSDIFFYASNGHGVWEAASTNLGSDNHTLLIAGSGHFSDQWAIQTEGLGLSVQRTAHTEGQRINVDAIETALKADTAHKIAAVMVVQTDTASGITSDLLEIRKAIDRAKHPAIYVVDVVASLAATAFDMDALGVDVCLGSSQKGLMMPPGLGFVAVNDKAFNWSHQHAKPRFYWSWFERKTPIQSAKFCGTPPLAHLAGLETSLQLLQSEGLQAVYARHQRLGGAVRAAVKAWSTEGTMQLHCKDPEGFSRFSHCCGSFTRHRPRSVANCCQREVSSRHGGRARFVDWTSLSHRALRRHE